jgi:cystathionine beta-lyase/cystathionine gamma-synthase/uncharacterized OsmC-like protein
VSVTSDALAASAAPERDTVRSVEHALATLHGGEVAMLAPNPVAATAAVLLTLTNRGGHVIASDQTYGPLRDFLLEDFVGRGRRVSLVDCTDPGAVVSSVEPATQVVYTQSLTDPLMRLCPLNELATYSQMNDLILVVDNTNLSPAQLRPLETGAVIVIEDCGPYLDGYGDIRAAAVAGGSRYLHRIREQARRSGAEVDPWVAHRLVRSLTTLELRMAEHDRNAEKVASALREHPAVRKVYRPSFDESPWALETHPGFGGLLSFEVQAEIQDLSGILAAFRPGGIIPGRLATTAQVPALTTHARMSERLRRQAGVSRQLVRLAVGIENVDRLLRDLQRALDVAGDQRARNGMMECNGVDLWARQNLAKRIQEYSWEAQLSIGVEAQARAAGRCDVRTEPMRLGSTRVARPFSLNHSCGDRANDCLDPVGSVLVALGACVAGTAVAALTDEGGSPSLLEVRARAEFNRSGGRALLSYELRFEGAITAEQARRAAAAVRLRGSAHRTLEEANEIHVVIQTGQDIHLTTRPFGCEPDRPSASHSRSTRVLWEVGAHVLAETDGVHAESDQPKQLFGADLAPNPEEYLLAALAAEALGFAAAAETAGRAEDEAGAPTNGPRTSTHASGRIDLRGPFSNDEAPVGMRNLLVQVLPADPFAARTPGAVDSPPGAVEAVQRWFAEGDALRLIRDAGPIEVTVVLDGGPIDFPLTTPGDNRELE